MTQGKEELELKLLPPDAAAMEAFPRVLGELFPRVEAQNARVLQDTYLDTAEWHLYRAGFGLRVRRGPQGQELTLKAATPLKSGVGSRMEYEQLVPGEGLSWPGSLPPGAVADLLAPMLGEISLDVKVALTKHQSVYRVLNGVDLEISATADRVEVHNGAGSGVFAELELELVSGAAADFREVAGRVREQLGFPVSSHSKYEQALRIAGVQPPRRDGQEGLSLKGEDRFIDAAYRILRRHYARFRWHEPGTRLGLDPESLHDMRVAVRRMLAALRLFREALPEPRYTSFFRDLKWVAGELGRVRDLDVHLDLLAGEAARLEPELQDILHIYTDYLHKERDKARGMMLRSLDTKRFANLCRKLDHFLASGPSRRPRNTLARENVLAMAPDLIRRRLKRVNKDGKALTLHSKDEAFHSLRKRCKRLRYAVEFFCDLYGKPAKEFARSVTAVQDDLGGHQDACVAIETMETYALGHSLPRGVGGKLHMALGMLIAWRRDEAVRFRRHFFRSFSKLKKKTWRKFQDVMEDLRPVDEGGNAPSPS